MILNANAKINLGLSILQKRNDEFHDIESIFIPIPWSDRIELTESEKVQFSSEGILIDGNSDQNLCLKAYQILKIKFNLPPVAIHLNKKIPIGAGLGGGSSDAAFVLKGLNELFSLNINLDELENYADQLGSDCSFFIRNKTALVSGKGEVLDTSIDLKLKTYCLVVNPGIHVSTQEAYSSVSPKLPLTPLREAIKQPKEKWQELIINDFESGIIKRYDRLKVLRDNLKEMGAYYVSMSGSGSSFYAFFEEQPSKLLFDPNYKYKIFELDV